MTHRWTKLFCWSLMCAILIAATSVSFAQSPPVLTEKQKAVLSFDIRLDRWMAGAKESGIDTSKFEDVPLQEPLENIKLSDVKRIFGMFSLPESMEKAMMMDPNGDLPMEFLVRIEFSNAAACQTAENKLKETDGTGTTEFGGVTYYTPPQGDGPANLVANRVNETTFQIATKNYAFQGNLNMRAAGLLEAWQQVPDDAIRLAADLETRADFIAEAVEMGKQGMPPMAGPFLDLIDNAKSMVISMDIGHDNLLNIVAAGVDEAQAEELRSGLDSLLGIAKMGGTAALAQMGDQMPEAAAAGKVMLADLKATREGNVVKVTIAKPAGFGEMVSKAAAMMQDQAKDVEKMNDFRQLALSIHNFADAYRKFPFDMSENENFNAELSWRTRVLPFIEQLEMFDQMDMKKGPGDEANAQFAKQMPKLFGADGSMSTVSWIKPDKPVAFFANITDGTSNTIMLIENPNGQPWLENNSLSIQEAVDLVLGIPDGAVLICAFYDGSVRKLDNGIDKETLRNLFDPNDGNLIEGFFDR